MKNFFKSTWVCVLFFIMSFIIICGLELNLNLNLELGSKFSSNLNLDDLNLTLKVQQAHAATATSGFIFQCHNYFYRKDILGSFTDQELETFYMLVHSYVDLTVQPHLLVQDAKEMVNQAYALFIKNKKWNQQQILQFKIVFSESSASEMARRKTDALRLQLESQRLLQEQKDIRREVHQENLELLRLDDIFQKYEIGKGNYGADAINEALLLTSYFNAYNRTLIDLHEIEFLLKRGAKINYADSCGFTALIWAANFGSRDSVHFLLLNGADINHQEESGNTALHEAVSKGNSKIVQLLLQSGANPNLRNMNGETALHWAVLEDRNNLIPDLLAAGANARIKTNAGITALSEAQARVRANKQRQRQQEIVVLLKAHLEKTKPTLMQSLHNLWPWKRQP